MVFEYYLRVSFVRRVCDSTCCSFGEPAPQRIFYSESVQLPVVFSEPSQNYMDRNLEISQFDGILHCTCYTERRKAREKRGKDGDVMVGGGGGDNYDHE